MNANINEHELALLAYLHDNAEGIGYDFPFEPNDVREALGMDDKTFRKAASFLKSFGLIGMGTTRADSYESSALFILNVYIEGLGENFMRELEAAPSIGTKITVAVVKETWTTIHKVAIGVLTELVQRQF